MYLVAGLLIAVVGLQLCCGGLISGFVVFDFTGLLV